MTSFGWKRKRTLQSKASETWFSAPGTGEDEEEKDEVSDGSVDWLVAAKRRRVLLLEDQQTKSLRLKEEGAVLAEHARYWEAIKYWEEAIQLTPGCAALYEMKSQVCSTRYL